MDKKRFALRKVNTMFLQALLGIQKHASWGVSFCAAVLAASPLAWAQTDAQRRQELRTSVRQQQAAPAAAPVVVVHHQLSEQQRSELRRQLARNLKP